MSSVDFVAVPAASPYVPFDDLHLGRSNQEVVCRLLRFWDARNIRKDNEFMGIVVLPLDEKNSTIHAFIPATRAAHYRRFLVEGSIIKLSAFEVSRCIKLYKITDHPFVIRFLYHTTVDQISDYVPKIGVEHRMLNYFYTSHTQKRRPTVCNIVYREAFKDLPTLTGEANKPQVLKTTV